MVFDDEKERDDEEIRKEALVEPDPNGDDEDEDGGDDSGDPRDKRKKPLKAIRLKCLDCSGGSWNEVSQCWAEDCPLYPFRFGKNPFRVKREMSEEQKEAARERFRLFREEKKKLQEQKESES